MPAASAPGKVYLFGEHAVVYGEPAIPCAIDRRARVAVTPREDAVTRIEAPDLAVDGFTVEYSAPGETPTTVHVPPGRLEALLGYVQTALDLVRERAQTQDHGLNVRIESEIPLGAGLGSSAAVTIATIHAAGQALDATLDRQEIAELGYRTEHDVQSGKASRADTFCSTMGGAVRVEGEQCARLGAPDMPFVIGFDGGGGETGVLVAAVRDLRESYGFARATIGTIGDLVRAGEGALDPADPAELGRLMDFNHGLLTALGVSAPSLDRMVWAARRAGAHGAKLTGAGGGGCVVALGEGASVTTALESTPGCESAFAVPLDGDGVRAEEVA